MSKFMQPVPAAELITESATAIEAIKTAAGFRDVHFQHLCMPVIRSFANHVQRLPLAKDAYRDVNGAWDMGLTASTVALRYAESQLFFPRLESEERRKIEPQCRFAAFAAVLASVVALQAQNAAISNGQADGGEDDYHVLVSPQSLYEFLCSNKQATMKWRADGHTLGPTEAAAIASKFMPPGLLAQFDLRIAQMLFGAIAPQATPNGMESTLAKVVRVSIGKVAERYMQRDAAIVTPGQANSANIDIAMNVGDALVAAANPRELVNPLELESQGPAVANAAPPTRPVAPSVPSVTLAVAAAPVQGAAAATADALLAAASPVLRDWFAALRKHERYPSLKTHLIQTERGTEVPLSMLGFFGVSGPAIRKMMTDAGMIVDRSTDHKAIILHPSLNTLLFEE